MHALPNTRSCPLLRDKLLPYGSPGRQGVGRQLVCRRSDRREISSPILAIRPLPDDLTTMWNGPEAATPRGPFPNFPFVAVGRAAAARVITLGKASEEVR